MVRYLARHNDRSFVKAAIISAVPPLMLRTAANPNGLPKEVFDGLQARLAANRSEIYRVVPEGPFYGYNRPGARKSEAIIANCGARVSGQKSALHEQAAVPPRQRAS